MLTLLEGVLAVFNQGLSSYMWEVNRTPPRGVDKTLMSTFKKSNDIKVALNCIHSCNDFYCAFAAARSDRFVVGLTYYSPADKTPVPGSYTVCGRYEGSVPAGGTVNLRCSQQRSARYVIVQFPTNDRMNFCELEVCAYGECCNSWISYGLNNYKNASCRKRRCSRFCDFLLVVQIETLLILFQCKNVSTGVLLTRNGRSSTLDRVYATIGQSVQILISCKSHILAS